MYSDRRLSSFYGPDLKGPVKKSHLPTRVCLVSAAVLMFALLGLFMYTGMAVLYIHFWVYVAAVSLIVLLLLGAGAFAIYNRFDTDRARRIVAIILGGLMLMLATMAYALCSLFMDMLQPIGYYDSPNGENRIVIMKSAADQGSVIEAYPAIGSSFYVAALESEQVLSNGVISGVEWEGERLAKVFLEDIDGNDTVLTVDFSILYAGEDETAE